MSLPERSLTALIDIDWGAAHRGAARRIGDGPGFCASPWLLTRGRQASAAGERVTWHTAAPDGAVALLEQLAGCRRALIAASPLTRGAAADLRATLLSSRPDLAPGAVELVDPWASAAGVTADAPAYDLAGGLAPAHAESDVLPMPGPVHPWSVPSAHNAPPERWRERLRAAALSLVGRTEPELYLNDDRIPTDMERLKAVAALVSEALKAPTPTMLNLHLRAWPSDLGSDRLLDHLTLLPLASLDVLAGSLVPSSLERMAPGLSADAVAGCLARIQARGLAHLTTVSLVLGLPGESAEATVDGLNEALKVILAARIRRVRLSLWLGDGALPSSSGEQDARFLESHPDWHPMEYRGIFDYVALLGQATPDLALVGPGLLPGWEPPEYG